MSTLTLAIPVHNDTANLARLLRGAARLGVGDRVIVVDDASSPAVRLDEILPPRQDPGWIEILRLDRNRGPGAARNLARDRAATEWLLYLDSDDQITPELPRLLRDLDGQAFDFCLMGHHDSRNDPLHLWGQTVLDDAHWRAAGGLQGPLSTITRAQAAILSETSNYPWNKIYRTRFLQDHGIGCTEQLLHEDMELHWLGFLRARNILVSGRVCLKHYVARGHGRLTERRGVERLAAFAPLERIAAAVATEPDGAFTLPFLRFATGLFDWISGTLEPRHRPALHARTRAFLLDRVDPETYAGIARHDPVLAMKINLQLYRGRE